MEVIIRRAINIDAQSIQKLYIELVGNDQNIKVDESSIAALEKDPCNYLLVAEEGKEILGTAFLAICRDVMYGNQPFAIVENIIVTSLARHRGVGKSLLTEIKSICKEQRCTKIMLLSNAKRPDAHKFFEANGYRGDLKCGFVNYINR